MPENEFEKKVSSEMQELRLKPSEKVWLQVEERIKKKKKRRVFIIIFFLAGIVLLGYWQRHNLFSGNETIVTKIDSDANRDNINSTEQNITTHNRNEAEPTTDATAKAKEKENSTQDKNDRKKNEDVSDITVTQTKDQVPKTNDLAKKKNATIKEKKETKPVRQQDQTDEAASLIITQTDPAIKTKEKKDSVEVKIEEDEIKKEEVKVPEVVGAENKVDSSKNEIADLKKEELVKTDTISAKEPLKDSAAAIVIQPTTSKKWKWGIEFIPGISSLHDELFSLNMNKSADFNSAPQSGSGFPIPPTPPSESSSSFAFQIGGFAKKQLTKKSSISIGLRYGYYSDKIRVGTDSAFSRGLFSSDASNFYRASNSFRNKTNSYHFIELPVNFSLRLNKNDKSPFEWQVGFSVSRLIASNALMYDTVFRGVYYKNNKLLNKTQFSLSTGLSFTVLNSKNFRWSAGPVVDLHLNSLYNNPLDSRKYLLFAGFRSRILFNQKK